MFRKRFAELSVTSKRSFWFTIVASILGLMVGPFVVYDNIMYVVFTLLAAAMTAGLCVLGLSIRKDKREAARS